MTGAPTGVTAPEAGPKVAARAPRPRRESRLWRDHRTAISRTIAVIVVLGIWEWAVESELVDSLFLSSPMLISKRMIEVFADGSIWPHIAASSQVAGLGFLFSVLLGVPLGTLMGRVPLARDTLEPFVMAKYSAPTVAFLPLLIIWFGIGLWSKVALVFLGGVFVIIISTQAGVTNVDRRLIETARSFTASEFKILLKVVAPAATPFIIAGMRLAIGRVLIMIVVAELFASNAGLGYLIFQAGAMYDTALIFVGVVLLSAAGVTLNSILRHIERRLAPWLEPDQG